jgi:hypothetical protein
MEPDKPPIGSRDFTFSVGVDDGAIRKLPVVGSHPFQPNEDDWPPPAGSETPSWKDSRSIIVEKFGPARRGMLGSWSPPPRGRFNSSRNDSTGANSALSRMTFPHAG